MRYCSFLAGGRRRYSSGESHPVHDLADSFPWNGRELTVENPYGLPSPFDGDRYRPHVATPVHIPFHIVPLATRRKAVEFVARRPCYRLSRDAGLPTLVVAALRPVTEPILDFIAYLVYRLVHLVEDKRHAAP